MRKLILWCVLGILAISAAGIAEETPEEVVWCEVSTEAPETTMVEEACLGGPGAYELCVQEAGEVYDQCMFYYTEWAYSNCANNWLDLHDIGQCQYECGADVFCMDECLCRLLGGDGCGSFGYNYYMFYCVQPLLWQGILECSAIEENHFNLCCYGPDEN
jgi:hypothetical protein